MRRLLLATAVCAVSCFGAITVAQDLQPTARTGAADARADADALAPEQTAAETRDLVNSSPADAVDITVYGGAYSQVQEVRRVRLKAGRNLIQLNGIATAYRQDSFRLLPVDGLAYGGGVYKRLEYTRERLLLESVGRKVTAWRHTKDGLAAVTGTLKSVAAGGLILEVDGKTELVNTNDVTLLDPPTGLSTTSSLVIEVNAAKAGTYSLDFTYETDGITWSAKHSLIFDEENSKILNWETTVSLVNESGTSFKNATLRLLTEKAVGNEGPGGVYPAAAMMRDSARAPQAPEAAVENVGDQKTYVIPHTVNVGVGETRQIPLFNASNIPVKRQYVVGSFAGRYGYVQEGSKFDAQIRLTVDNCDKHNLGKALPAGLVKVYAYNSAKKVQATGGTAIGDKAVNEVFDLNIGTSSDIKWEVRQVSATPVADAGAAADSPNPRTQPRPGAAGPGRAIVDPTNVAPTTPQNGEPKHEFEDRLYEITVFNFKTDRDVKVKVEVNVPAKQQLEPKWLRPRAERAETELSVPKSGKTSVEYTIRTRVR
jgi:hypothetical protein